MMNAPESDFNYRILRNHSFGLIDPSVTFDLPAGIVGKPIVPTALQASKHLMPMLLDLRALTDENQNVLLASFYDAHTSHHPPPIRLLIDTDETAEQLTRRWNRLQLASLAPGFTSWLRLHDPRVLHQLLRILTPAQQLVLLGKASALQYWVGDNWNRFGANDVDLEKGQSSGIGSYGVHLAWDWRRIEDIGIINRALEIAEAEAPNVSWQRSELAEQLIIKAREAYALTNTNDLVEFVTRGLLTNSDFDRHPKIAVLINPADDPEDDSTLSDRLALIDESIWNELRPSTLART
jgi:hypothetical protein